jgi:anti-sigma regulatory factor (Ser/Thr protein kinase)
MLGRLLREWQLDELSDAALLLVSELVTNAVKASESARRAGWLPASRQLVALTVRLTDTRLVMEVWDVNPDPPVRRDAGLTAECGRGLCIVEFLGDDWGHHPADGGKVVWCELGLPA